MEGLIIFIVITIISMLVKGKDNKQQPKNKQMPPFSNQKAQPTLQRSATKQPTRRTLEDFANEIFSELNEKKQDVRQVQQNSAAGESNDRAAIVETVDVKPNSARERGKLVERPLVQQLKQENKDAFEIVPKTRQALMQAVVMSEVLGSPKARKRS